MVTENFERHELKTLASSLHLERVIFSETALLSYNVNNLLENAAGSIVNPSVQFSHSVVSDSLQPHGLQDTRLSCPSQSPGVYPDSCPLSQ